MKTIKFIICPADNHRIGLLRLVEEKGKVNRRESAYHNIDEIEKVVASELEVGYEQVKVLWSKDLSSELKEKARELQEKYKK